MTTTSTSPQAPVTGPARRTPSAAVAAAAGVASGALTVAAADLVAGLVAPDASPVLAVGGAAVDRVPGALKDFAVATFGAYDKPVLLAGIGVVLVLLSALAGLLARHRPAAGLAVVGVLGAVGVFAAVSRPGTSGAVDVVRAAVPTLTGAALGGLALHRLTCTSRSAPEIGAAQTASPAERGISSSDPSRSPRRRGVLRGLVAVGGAALLAGAGGRLLAARRAGHGGDMFSRLVRAKSEEGAVLSDADIVDHMVFLMMAAHDTTTSTLTSMTYELAKHPEWQERVREESRALGTAEVGFEDLDKLASLTWVIKETIRRYPPLPVIPRVATRAFDWAGYRVPANAMVVISPIHTHHMAEWWNEPTRFDPERFAPARAEDQRHTHAWIPFGGGPHLCLGMHFADLQIKSIMHQLLLRYRWSVPAGYAMPVQQAPISKPLDGLPIDLQRI